MTAFRILALALMALVLPGGLPGYAAPAAEITTILPDTMPRFGTDSVQCIENWNIYDQHYRHQYYDLAYEPWKRMLENCPRATPNIYTHGINMLRYFHDNETDPEKRGNWLTSLMELYDQRILYFGEKGRNLGRKATTLYQLQPENVQEIFELSEQSILLEGNAVAAQVLVINFHSATRLAMAGLMETEILLEVFERAYGIIGHNMVYNPADQRLYETAKNNIHLMFEPFADCESLARVYGPQFEQSPRDTLLLERIIEWFSNAGCTNEELYYEATAALHQIRPKAASARLLGQLENDRGNPQAAVAYLAQAAQLYAGKSSPDYQEQIFRAYLVMAEINYRQLGQKPRAREFALKAQGAKPGDGRPLILIGEMYAASAGQCGEDEFSAKLAYWPAVDKFTEAMRVAEDSVIRERAAQFASTYKQYFPNGEEIFFHGYSVGDSFRVGCWINESTTVRAR